MSDNEQTNKKIETVADILEEMRGMGNYQRYSGDHAHALADRIEAAWKLERSKVEADALAVGGIVEAARTAEKSSAVGNAAAMREALEYAGNELRRATEDSRYGDDVVYLVGCMRTVAAACRAALAAPARNCDVGTPEEQAERMRLYCNSHGEDESGCFRCEKCPFLTDERCELAWAQIPYKAEEGVRK